MSLPHSSGVWKTELVVSPVPCLFRGLVVANKDLGSGFWVWVCDSATGAGVTESTCCPVWCPPGGNAFLDWSQTPRKMVQGLYVCATTDAQTKTLIATPEAFFETAYDRN